MKIVKNCLLLMGFLVSLSVFAESPGEKTHETEDGVDTEKEDKLSVSEANPDTATEENIFSALFETASANADKILSALAFLGSLLLAFAYRKGLFPFVERSLSALGTAVGNLGDEIKRNELQKTEFTSIINNKLASVEGLITSFGEKIKTLEGELGSMEKERNERESMKLIMRTEVDMLFEIISASSLPQYQKDRANECFMKMKESLKAGDAYEKEN